LPASWKAKGGANGWGTYKPKAGDTGTIVHVFIEEESSPRSIYLLKISHCYVPVGCHYLTSTGQPDSREEATQHYLRDSIENVHYASGCKFKLQNVNGSWSRVGLMNIDRMSETFACELVSKGIDTVLLCKYIFDNGSLSTEKAFVLWLNKGHGYIKSFFNNTKHQYTENKTIPFNVKSLTDYFFLNKLGTVRTKPKSEIMVSHDMGYSIQLHSTSLFFRERLTDFAIRQAKTHSGAIWWNPISEKLAALKED
jgi:hypothetical protein